jgi:hypothetical protein
LVGKGAGLSYNAKVLIKCFASLTPYQGLLPKAQRIPLKISHTFMIFFKKWPRVCISSNYSKPVKKIHNVPALWHIDESGLVYLHLYLTNSKQWTMFSRFNKMLKFKHSISICHKDLSLYYYGSPWSSIHHSRFRMGFSILNAELFNNFPILNTELRNSLEIWLN